eukprot:TRINITY_DN21656_c1_g1_i1.p1 TRINITY_DN21656_c1_g1~~TRINITY_DN21656_c1_g1_i1.p1  ORF type:complete len:982 (+),score=78.58 TRINITY_DN21656_c1_g1_i1:116-3061(+)
MRKAQRHQRRESSATLGSVCASVNTDGVSDPECETPTSLPVRFAAAGQRWRSTGQLAASSLSYGSTLNHASAEDHNVRQLSTPQTCAAKQVSEPPLEASPLRWERRRSSAQPVGRPRTNSCPGRLSPSMLNIHPQSLLQRTWSQMPPRRPRGKINLREHAHADDELGATFHDWTEDYRWQSVGEHRRGGALLCGGFLLQKAWNRCQGWIAVVLTGVSVGTLGAMMDVGTLWMHQITRGHCLYGWWLPSLYCNPGGGSDNTQQSWADALGFGGQWRWFVDTTIYFTACCFMTLLAAWLTLRVAPEAAGAGIPEIKAMLGGARLTNIGSPLTLCVKFAATVLSVGGNISVGKAGPMVHIGFCCASLVSRMFEKYRHSMGKRRELLTAGTAAGMCVAFGSPLGGVLYALEETASYFGPQALIRSFVCSTMAAVTLRLYDPYRTQKLTLFAINYHGTWNLWEIPLFVLCGVCGGCVGVLFIRFHLFISGLRQRIRKSKPWRVLLEACTVALFNCCVTTALLPDGKASTDAEYLEHLFRRCINSGAEDDCTLNSETTVALFVTKFVLTGISFGLFLPGGFLLPSLVMGGAMGWSLASAVDAFVNSHRHWSMFETCDPTSLEHTGTLCVLPSVYALVGAGAVLCGVTRMTISLVTIMFELTGGLEYVIPVTIGVVVSKWVADGLGGRDSIYTLLMDVKGLNFLDPKTDTGPDAAAQMKESIGFDDDADGMTVLHEQQTLQHVIEALKCRAGLAKMGYPIVKGKDDPRVIGFISRRRLTLALNDLHNELQNVGVEARADATVVLGDPAVMVPESPASGVSDGTGGARSITTASHASDCCYILTGYVDNAPVTVRNTIDVARVVLIFRRLGLSSVLVVDESNHLCGWLSKVKVIQHIQKGGQSRADYFTGKSPGGGAHSGFDQDELEDGNDTNQVRNAWEKVAAMAAAGEPQSAHVLPRLDTKSGRSPMGGMSDLRPSMSQVRFQSPPV